MTTLAALISGMVASKSTQLPKVASQVPDGNQPESRVKRFTRWVGNERISEEVSFLPSADILMEHLALQTLVLVIDGSVVGRGCVALMIHMVSTGRALPLCLQQTLEDAGWSYVCRTGCNLTATWDGMTFRLDTLRACLKPGNLIDVPEALFTAEAYGPIRLICCWAKGHQEPLYLVTNLASAEEACRLYAKRFRIETFFRDQKSRGFQLHKSHLSDPKRLSRLFIAACLASLWIVSLGSRCLKDGWVQMIHRTNRCDLSVFQLGMRLLDHFLNENLSIPVAFHIPSEESKSVR